ncbi:hypothetical protein SAMN05216570_3456 [Dyella sp. OK004]|uniref:hypothetical protein n=1 Tax=Dyella sp. OK004 TaxID=1855292 RepID=UPI0008E48506|nr:hypothetical protein [Dyella sp. OK004]SFS17058.1 hypothetical protein SAMN05216570_3456 [Dyella sp. OK004]
MPIRRHAIVALLLAGSAAAHAMDAPVLGAHTLLTHSEGMGKSPAVTEPLDTQPSGSALIVFNGGYASNDARPVDSYANRWKQLGRSVYYNGYGGSFNVSAYVALNAKGGAQHTVRIDKPGNASGEISVPFIEVKQAGVLQDVAQNYPETGLVLTSGNVTTTGPATLIAVWWGDGGVKHMTARPDNDFTVIDSYLLLPDNSGVQVAVASRQVTTAGTYHVSWVGSPIQGAILWLFAFQAK